jgi:hypothetical protein
MKILFLDIDGVLNSHEWEQKRPSKEQALLLFPGNTTDEKYALRYFDPEAVKRLNRIIKETKAAVVISSSWRTDWSLVKLNFFLQYHGFEFFAIGTTPCGVENRIPNLYAVPTRGDEVNAWLGAALQFQIEHYVIVDDGKIDGHRPTNVLQTDPIVGLTDNDAYDLIQRLS